MRKVDTKELTYGEAIKRIQKLDNLNGLLITEIDAQRQRQWALGEAYLRLRRLIGQAAFETPHGPTPEQVWTTTEIALAALVAQVAQVDAQRQREHETRGELDRYIRQLEGQNERLTVEIDRMRPIVEAAVKWNKTNYRDTQEIEFALDALGEACDDYEAAKELLQA